ncbi:MAG: YitT family protein [Acidimicrobiales bacterium]
MTRSRFITHITLKEQVRRLPRVMIGLTIFGIGISLMIVAELGLGPWDVFHQGLSELLGLEIGTIIILVGVVLVAVLLALREPIGLGTIANMLVIGLVANIVIDLLEQPDSIALRTMMMLVGPVIVGLGTGIYLGSHSGPGPRDGLMTALSRRGPKVWQARTAIEVVVLIAGWLLGGNVGVGTVWFAISVGPFVHFFLHHLEMDIADEDRLIALDTK